MALEGDAMRRTGSRSAAVAALAMVVAVGTAAQGARAVSRAEPLPPPVPSTGILSLNFNVDRQGRTAIKGGQPGTSGRTWGYWGRLTGTDGYGLSGSYRATCVWLADKAWKTDPDRRDNRMSCTVEMSFRSVRTTITAVRNSGSLVAQGLVRRPHDKKFLVSEGSPRRIAIVGGDGSFVGRRGTLDLSGTSTLAVSFV
jgi:hypothetical protein